MTKSSNHIQSMKTLALAFMLSLITLALGQSPEWSERDLAKSVHRAEQTFQAGEMSRAYGLFAHLVSVAGDRPFLHFRFGATCTYTTQRLPEAEDHLEMASELGILDTKHAAEWHYYMGRLCHMKYKFDEASMHFRRALDLEEKQVSWVEDAKLRYGQCNNQAGFPIDYVMLDSKDVLISHSQDFFRLYEMPVSDGRLLVVPQQLMSKEDKKRGYESQLHWLPGKRYAYFASYGKNGDTGLDVYRVAVDGFGDYGEPVKMPPPINTDYDDCAPICVPGNQSGTGQDRIYFSSSRPESLGGFDIFAVDGSFTREEIIVHNEASAEQLPFEINSAANEFLYFENQSNGEAWLTTNRNQDFEGQEVWRFSLDWNPVGPVGVTLKNGNPEHSGSVKLHSKSSKEIFELHLNAGETAEILLQSDADFILHWETENGGAIKEELIRLPQEWSNSVLSDPIELTSESSILTQIQLNENTAIAQENLQWTENAMASRIFSEHFAEVLSGEQLAHIRAAKMSEVSIEKVLQAALNDQENQLEEQSLPNWMIKALQEAELLPTTEHLPQTVHHARAAALQIQSQMEKAQCWDAPGSDEWKVQAAIARYGEPSIAVLSDETRELQKQTESQRNLWDNYFLSIESHMRSTGIESEDWNIMLAFFDAQRQSFEGAVVHAEDMFRRIDSHLRYERWLVESLPMNVPGFKDGLTALVNQSPEASKKFTALAHAIAQNIQPDQESMDIHSVLWDAIADKIINLHKLGIYDLIDMKESQDWFLRSGGIIDDIASLSNPEERRSKGQQAIGLAWETYCAGAEHYDRVMEESKMSPVNWWRNFKPATDNFGSATEGTAYEGYRLFETNDDQILEQAQQYQSELDIIRSTSKDDSRHVQSMKNALVMRSNIAHQMTALFGGESQSNGTIPIRQVSRSPVNKAPVEVESMKPEEPIKPIESPVTLSSPVVSSPPAIIEKIPASLTIQIGAFTNEPDFSKVPDNDQIYKLSSQRGLTKYAVGSFANKEQALIELELLRKWFPDAFLTTGNLPLQAASTSPAKEKTEHLPEKAAKPSSSVPAKPATIHQKKQFHVHIMDYFEGLKPSEVAKLLRLGNLVPLKTIRLANKTIYFTYPYDSIEEAQTALETCLENGFTEAEIEVVY